MFPISGKLIVDRLQNCLFVEVSYLWVLCCFDEVERHKLECPVVTED